MASPKRCFSTCSTTSPIEAKGEKMPSPSRPKIDAQPAEGAERSTTGACRSGCPAAPQRRPVGRDHAGGDGAARDARHPPDARQDAELDEPPQRADVKSRRKPPPERRCRCFLGAFRSNGMPHRYRRPGSPSRIDKSTLAQETCNEAAIYFQYPHVGVAGGPTTGPGTADVLFWINYSLARRSCPGDSPEAEPAPEALFRSPEAEQHRRQDP